MQHVRGAQSFNELKIVDGVLHQTFKAAAIERGLVDDDSEWVRCLDEASIFRMPRQFRQIFALICIFNSPKNPVHLYQTFLEYIVEDFIRIFPGNVAERKALQDIESVFQMHGMKCTDYGLPEAGPIVNTEQVYNTEDEAREAQNLIATLNPKQREIFDEIVAAVSNNQAASRFFFIDGPGGSGKTYLYNTLMSHLRGQKKRVQAFATTGIAADLLKGGRTVHSGFKIPISAVETSVSSMKVPSYESAKLHEASLLIIDEASMLSSHSLRIIDKLLREVMNDTRPFGGKTLILGGDFRQTTNVVPRGSVTDILEVCIKNSQLWQHVKQYSLTDNMRTSGQEDFNQWVLRLGNGELTNGIDVIDPDLIKFSNY